MPQESALEAALRSCASAVLVIASRRKAERLRTAMKLRGISQERIDAMHAPAGPVKVWGTLAPDGRTRVAMINKSPMPQRVELQLPPAAGPLVTLAVPFLDTGFVVAKRIKYRRPVYTADRNHFHHRFANVGFSQRRTVFYLYGWTLVLAGSQGYEAAEAVDELANSPARDRIRITGYLTDEEIGQWYARAAIFAFPSNTCFSSIEVDSVVRAARRAFCAFLTSRSACLFRIVALALTTATSKSNFSMT